MRSLVLALLATVGAGCSAVKDAAVGSVIASRRAGAGLIERQATVDGRRVAYLERPGSAPALVLLHGFGAQKDAWLDLVDALPTGRRILVPDLAGHGDSPAQPSVRYDGLRYAADVAAWLDEISAGLADLAGNSMGGLVATLVAIERPDAVRRLVLMDPAGVPSPMQSGLDSLVATGTNPLIPTTRAEYDRLVSFVFAQDPGLPGIARDVLAADTRRRAPFLRGLFGALNDTPGDLLAHLPEVEQPVLLIWGERDRVIDASAAPLWAEALPDVQLEILPGIGHAPMMEAPDEVARLVSDFLR